MSSEWLQIEKYTNLIYIHIFENIAPIHDKILKYTVWYLSICIKFNFSTFFHN